MNMKKIYSIMTIFMSLALLLSSCSDALDVAPSGDISLEEVFSDNDRTMYYLNTCYSSLPNKGRCRLGCIQADLRWQCLCFEPPCLGSRWGRLIEELLADVFLKDPQLRDLPSEYRESQCQKRGRQVTVDCRSTFAQSILLYGTLAVVRLRPPYH